MITIFTTGGTFDKLYFDANSQFSIGDTQVTPILQEGNVTIDYQVEEVLRKDSLEITQEDRQHISEKVAATKSKQIIITHGTDTMAQTAKMLSTYDLSTKTIVLVGAMQPARMRCSDAPFNLGFALAAVQLLSADVYIAMNGRLFHHSNVAKNRAGACFETE
ncbi:asparaginase [Candidatus Endobugula sertula]|uniref:Asparaginase n=1 Tax=Candidatus Endobugula sertula TaxID=62101 RepID=A0A1D2QRA7_9GAMM|nr:asparaginase [Candidatus Endobugula sertula]